MRKIICLLVVLLLLLTACAQPRQQLLDLRPVEIEKKDYSQYQGIVMDTKAWYEEFNNLPIANENMTQEELRQLCADAFRLNMTMPWTPNQNIEYTYTLLGNSHDVSLPEGFAYSGLCYATGIENATYGNAWKMLLYWDPETGTLDVAAMGSNALNIISSACSYGAMQGWNRVSNSHGLKEMNSYSMYESNIVPVGPYAYEPFTYGYNFRSRSASNEIIEANGADTIYESYALTDIADGVFSSSAYHVMMISQKPVVVRGADGGIDPQKSYVHVHEQGGLGSRTDDTQFLQENGKIMRPLGTVHKKYTFEKLLQKGYIPFTLKEFIGEDPVEPGKAWLGTSTDPIENGKDMQAGDIFSYTLNANYNVCGIKVEVKSPDGKVLVSYRPFVATQPKTLYVRITGGLNKELVEPYANGKNTIHIYAQLSNGEMVEAFSTLMKLK